MEGNDDMESTNCIGILAHKAKRTTIQSKKERKKEKKRESAMR